MKSDLLKSIIKDKGMTMTSVAKKLNLSRETLYNRINNGDFKASEIVEITRILSLSRKERDNIFFN